MSPQQLQQSIQANGGDNTPGASAAVNLAIQELIATSVGSTRVNPPTKDTPNGSTSRIPPTDTMASGGGVERQRKNRNNQVISIK